MRVGIFGGTFDPVHVGHLILAEQAREQARLDEVWFLPAPRPPQKDARSITRLDQRVEMLALALAGQPAFRINELEKDRPGLSFTVDTLEELQRLHPEHAYFLLVGGDSLADLPLWREPRRILELVGLVAMARAGVVAPRIDELRQRLRLPADASLALEMVQAPVIDVSSRDLRRRVAERRSIRYFVPRAVEVYIHEKRLYSRGTEGPHPTGDLKLEG